MKFDPAEMALILEQANQEAKKNRLAYTEKKVLTYDGNLDNYLVKEDMPDGVGGTRYLIKLLDTAIDLYSVTRVLLVTASGYSDMIELSGENSRIENDSEGTGFLYVYYQGIELPVLAVSKHLGTITFYFDSIYGSITCWAGSVEIQTIHPIPQEYIPPLDALYLNGTDGVRYKLYVDAAGQLQVEVV